MHALLLAGLHVEFYMVVSDSVHRPRTVPPSMDVEVDGYLGTSSTHMSSAAPKDLRNILMAKTVIGSNKAGPPSDSAGLLVYSMRIPVASKLSVRTSMHSRQGRMARGGSHPLSIPSLEVTADCLLADLARARLSRRNISGRLRVHQCKFTLEYCNVGSMLINGRLF